MSFRAVIASSGTNFSPSEERAVSVLLGVGTSTLTAAEIAAKAATHESTVVRLAKKLGYRGFGELRADLRRDETDAPTGRPLMRAASGYDLETFLADESSALRHARDYIRQSDIDDAARAIAASRVAYILSNEAERASLVLLAGRLRRLGLPVIELRPSPKDLAERIVSFDEDSVLIGIALREAPIALAPLVSEARRRGGKSILIADVPGYSFRPAPDHLIAAPRGADDEYRTQIVPVAIAYALQLAVFHLDEQRFGAVRDAIDDLSRAFGGTNEIPMRP